jgi:hypothetical protein
MASGHVNRIYRPNTWQHRPSLRREDFSCQPGAVHTWHETDRPTGSDAWIKVKNRKLDLDQSRAEQFLITFASGN